VRRSADPSGAGWARDPATGLWLRRTRGSNMIVLAGLSFMAKSIQYGHADAGGTLRYMAVGTGYTAPAKDDTALVAELLRVEIESWDNANIDSDPVVMIASKLFLTSQANGALMECGLFKASTGTPMFCRGLFGTGLITNATQADPVVIESLDHGLADGDKILIEGVAGMTELNNNTYFVDQLDGDTFALYTDAGLTAAVDGTGYGAYEDASPNTAAWKTIIPKTSAETLTVTYSLTFPAD
jgi:hypothetical protein